VIDIVIATTAPSSRPGDASGMPRVRPFLLRLVGELALHADQGLREFLASLEPPCPAAS
jgi:hypothetical protein